MLVIATTAEYASATPFNPQVDITCKWMVSDDLVICSRALKPLSTSKVVLGSGEVVYSFASSDEWTEEEANRLMSSVK